MNFKSNDSRDIIAAFRQGEEAGFDFFFKKYYKALVFFARRYVFELAIAEDLAEEAFINVWDKRAQLETEAGIRAYLYRAVHNNCLRWLDREGKRGQVHSKYLSTTGEREEDHLINMIRAETLRQVKTAVEGLPEQCRKVFLKLFIEGKTVREAAAELRLSISNVKNQKARGIKLLKDRLGKSFGSL